VKNVVWAAITGLALLVCGAYLGVPAAHAESASTQVACPAGLGNAQFSRGGNFAYGCNNHKTTPQIAFLAAPLLVADTNGAAFNGDCNDGHGVKVGVKISASDNGCVGDANTNPIYFYLRNIIRFAAGLFGLGVTLMIIVAGIQYITSTGNPQGVTSAKNRLANAVISIILFLLMFAILNFLIPGGIV
jgi:hypothetical protein